MMGFQASLAENLLCAIEPLTLPDSPGLSGKILELILSLILLRLFEISSGDEAPPQVV